MKIAFMKYTDIPYNVANSGQSEPLNPDETEPCIPDESEHSIPGQSEPPKIDSICKS